MKKKIVLFLLLFATGSYFAQNFPYKFGRSDHSHHIVQNSGCESRVKVKDERQHPSFKNCSFDGNIFTISDPLAKLDFTNKDSVKEKNNFTEFMIGSGVVILNNEPGLLLFQLGIMGNRNNFKYELGYIAQPFSEFGIKNRYMALCGGRKLFKKTTELHFLAGVGYYHTSKHNTEDKPIAYTRAYYPGGFRLIAKMGYQQKLSKNGKWISGLGFYISNDTFYYSNASFPVPTINFNGLINVIYRW